MRLAALLSCLLLLVACRPEPKETLYGQHHTVVVASRPLTDFYRARLTPEHLDQVDDLLLRKCDWTGALMTGDEIDVLISLGKVRAVRIRSRNTRVAAVDYAGVVFDESGFVLEPTQRLRPIAARDLTSYPLHGVDPAWHGFDPVRLEKGDNGVLYGVARGATLTAVAPGTVHVLSCSGYEPLRTCEMEVAPDDGAPELWVVGPLKPLAADGARVRAGQPIASVLESRNAQVRFGLLDDDAPRPPGAEAPDAPTGIDSHKNLLRVSIVLSAFPE